MIRRRRRLGLLDDFGGFADALRDILPGLGPGQGLETFRNRRFDLGDNLLGLFLQILGCVPCGLFGFLDGDNGEGNKNAQ